MATGISKPTVGESVRRLEEAGLVQDTGERTSGRGGSGTYYALSDNVGVALAVSIAPEGIVAETVESIRSRASPGRRAAAPPGNAAAVARRLGKAAQEALRDSMPSRLRVAVVVAADPVDRATGAWCSCPTRRSWSAPCRRQLRLRPW